jgi:hypothetical protein
MMGVTSRLVRTAPRNPGEADVSKGRRKSASDITIQGPGVLAKFQ